METQTTNPFSQIDNRLKSIEDTLALLAAREERPAEKKYYTIREAAKKLNVAAITLYRHGQAGKVPLKKIGSRLMIPGSFIDA